MRAAEGTQEVWGGRKREKGSRAGGWGGVEGVPEPARDGRTRRGRREAKPNTTVAR